MAAMSSDLRESVKELVNRRLRELEHEKDVKRWWILEHRDDVHCIFFNLMVLAGYGVAFFIYLHPGLAHISNRGEMAAFVVTAGLLLGWVSGVNVGLNFHNHVHRRVFRVAWVNAWFGRLWALSGG